MSAWVAGSTRMNSVAISSSSTRTTTDLAWMISFCSSSLIQIRTFSLTDNGREGDLKRQPFDEILIKQASPSSYAVLYVTKWLLQPQRNAFRFDLFGKVYSSPRQLPDNRNDYDCITFTIFITENSFIMGAMLLKKYYKQEHSLVCERVVFFYLLTHVGVFSFVNRI